MITAKIPHITLTGKDGYVFRKRYVAKTLYLALRTKEEQQAMQRGAAVSMTNSIHPHDARAKPECIAISVRG